jgi:hypothetical protein
VTRIHPGWLVPCVALLACAAARAPRPELKKELSPLAWMQGEWTCQVTSLDSGAVEPARLRFFPEIGGAWLGGELVLPGRSEKPLFELVSHLGRDREGRWTRIDVDVSGRVKTLRADAAGDSTLWAPADGGDFRERIDRKGDAGLHCTIEGLENGAWQKQITFDCTRR